MPLTIPQFLQGLDDTLRPARNKYTDNIDEASRRIAERAVQEGIHEKILTQDILSPDELSELGDPRTSFQARAQLLLRASGALDAAGPIGIYSLNRRDPCVLTALGRKDPSSLRVLEGAGREDEAYQSLLARVEHISDLDIAQSWMPPFKGLRNVRPPDLNRRPLDNPQFVILCGSTTQDYLSFSTTDVDATLSVLRRWRGKNKHTAPVAACLADGSKPDVLTQRLLAENSGISAKDLSALSYGNLIPAQNQLRARVITVLRAQSVNDRSSVYDAEAVESHGITFVRLTQKVE